MPTRVLAVGALSLAAAAVAVAQSPPADSEIDDSTAAGEGDDTDPSAPAAPTKDLFDLLRELRGKPPPPPPSYKKRMVAAAPVISYGPTSGVGVGVAGNVAFYKGTPATTRISSMVASAIVTTRGQLLVNGKLDASSIDNVWRLEGDNRLYWTSQETYGLGTGTTPADAVDMKYNYFRFDETVFREVHDSLYLGAGLLYGLHADVRAADADDETWPDSPYVTYSEEYGFDLDSQTSAGVGLNLLFDSRDSAINPSRGWYAHLTYEAFFRGFLGGTSTWQQTRYDLRTYVRLTKDARHKLAFWAFGDLGTGGVAPYLDLPATGSDTYGRSGRGYPQGRFRGQSLVYGEVAYRWTITKNGLFGMVAFLNVETLSDEQTGQELFDSYAPGAGVGLRLMLNKRSRTNLCFDFGWGKDGSQAVYFAVQEAF